MMSHGSKKGFPPSPVRPLRVKYKYQHHNEYFEIGFVQFQLLMLPETSDLLKILSGVETSRVFAERGIFYSVSEFGAHSCHRFQTMERLN